MRRKLPARKAPWDGRGAWQREQIEVGLICLSGLLLYQAVLRAGSHEWSLGGHCLAFVHGLSLFLEFGSLQLVSPYQLRKSDSHGLAHGVLAVPSVLAALAATVPQGTLYHWFLGSCAAALAILITVYIQTKHTSALHSVNSTTDNSNSISEDPHLKQHPHVQHPAHTGETATQSQEQRQSQSMFNVAQLFQPAMLVSLAAIAASCGGGVPGLTTAGSSNMSIGFQAVVLGGGAAPALYCLVMQILPGCFSIGEGAMAAQGAAGLLVAAVQSVSYAPLYIPAAVCSVLPQKMQQQLGSLGSCSNAAHQQALTLAGLSAVVTLILAAVLLVCLLLHGLVVILQSNSKTVSSRVRQQPSSMLSSVCSWLGISMLGSSIAVLMLWLASAAAWTLLEFLPARPGRLLVLLYWVVLLAVTLPGLRLWASHSQVPQIVIRKVYHLLAGGLFVPVFFWDLQLLCLSLAIAFAALVLLEVLRKLQLLGLGQAVQKFMQDFVDERDSGVIYVTHFTLLLGLAVPMWLCLGLPGTHQLTEPQSFAGYSIIHRNSGYRSNGSTADVVCRSSDNAGGCVSVFGSPAVDVVQKQLHNSQAELLLIMAGLSGMIIIGVGDTAASMVGKLLGRVPIHTGSRKTVEGTIAGIASSLGAWWLLLWCVGLSGGGWRWWLHLVAVTVGAGLMEACTSQLDNILLPLWYMPHLMLLHQSL